MFVKNIISNIVGSNDERIPQQHIIEDDDEYVEVTGVDDAEEGWEEVMVVTSPTLHTTPITPITATSLLSTIPQDIANVVEEVVVVKEVPITIIPVVPLPTQVIASNDPEWLGALKRQKVPYVVSQDGVNYIASYTTAEPYAHASTGFPYASPQEGTQYLSSINAPVSYTTQSIVISKGDTDEAKRPYCVAYH